jgi:hypothetical protein
VDIEEDDENDDRADFANYLTNMLPPSMKDKALETAETHEHQHASVLPKHRSCSIDYS